MLHLLRRAVKSLPAKILLGVLIASFAIWGIGDIFNYRGESAVASVGDEEVPASRLAESLVRAQRTLSNQQQRLVTLQELRQAGLAEATLAGLIRDAAFEQELHRLGIRVPASAVRDAIAANKSFQDGQGQFSPYLYKSRLGQSGYDPQTYETLTRQLLGQQLLADAVSPAVVAPPAAAEKIAAHRGETRVIDYVTMTPGMAPDPGTPTEEQLSGYYTQHSQQFMEPERRSGFYLHTDLDALAKANAPTEEEVRAEYEAHPESYSVRATRDVEQIVFDDMEAAEAAAGRIRSGEASFAEVAAEQDVSKDDLSLGTVSEQDLPAASAKAVFAQTGPGLAGPVEGPFGALLYNVTKVQTGGVQPFDEVKDEIRQRLARRRAVDAAVKKANEIEDLRAAGTPLPDIAAKTGVELVRFRGLGPKGTVAEGTAPPLASNDAFMKEVDAAGEGEERDIVRLPDGSYVLVMVEKVMPSHVPDLAKIRDRVTAAWAGEQRMEWLENRATDLAGQIAEKGGLAPVATAEELGEPQSASFTRETVPPVLTPALTQAAFGAKPGDPLVGRTAGGDAVLLGVLDKVEPLAADALAESAAKIDEALVASLKGDQLEYFARAVEAEQGVEVNRDAVEQVFTRIGQSGR